MYAISSAASRVLIITSTPRTRSTAKCAASATGTLGASTATRSPGSTPARASAPAKRPTCSANSAQVARVSP